VSPIQENIVERLALDHGAVHVAASRYAGGTVEMTVPGGACFRVQTNGAVTAAPFNHSINWSAE
jgi:hypothetical protein